jgi:hypothetical protein
MPGRSLSQRRHARSKQPTPGRRTGNRATRLDRKFLRGDVTLTAHAHILTPNDLQQPRCRVGGSATRRVGSRTHDSRVAAYSKFTPLLLGGNTAPGMLVASIVAASDQSPPRLVRSRTIAITDTKGFVHEDSDSCR